MRLLSMKLVDEWNQIIVSEAPPKIKMLNKGLDLTLDTVKWREEGLAADTCKGTFHTSIHVSPLQCCLHS